MRVLACPDKFRGTLDAPAAADAIASGAARAGADVARQPMADGGEGTVDAFGGATHGCEVTGPLGDPVQARYRLAGGLAVIEMASASGLALAGGAERNDPLAATTQGTGELISAALRGGASEIIVGVGGSATTDGGLGAIEALRPHGRLRGVDLRVAADVRTRFLDAPAVFGPQKGASPAAVRLLEGRLEQLAGQYQDQFGIDVRELDRSGAAGGLAGGLAALGATLEDGFGLIADAVELDRQIEEADLVVTGEGALDATSWSGKVVGGVVEMAAAAGVAVVVVAGRSHGAVPDGVEVIDLVERYGETTAMTRTAQAVADAVSEILSR